MFTFIGQSDDYKYPFVLNGVYFMLSKNEYETMVNEIISGNPTDQWNPESKKLFNKLMKEAMTEVGTPNDQLSEDYRRVKE